MNDNAVLIKSVIHTDLQINVGIGHPNRHINRNSNGTKAQLLIHKSRV